MKVKEEGGEGDARSSRQRELTLECSDESRGSRPVVSVAKGCCRPGSGAVGGVQPAMHGLL